MCWGVDLLQTKYIDRKPPQNWPKNLGAHLQRHPCLGRQIEAFQIEGGDAQAQLSCRIRPNRVVPSSH